MHTLVLTALLLAACGDTEPASAPPAPPAPVAPAAKPAAAPAAPAAGAATAEAAPAATGDVDLADGEKTYKQYCIACHQADGKGMNGTLAGDYTSGRLNDKTEEQLLHSIREGFAGKVGNMPAWKGVLSDAQMKNALGYVKKTYSPPAK